MYQPYVWTLQIDVQIMKNIEKCFESCTEKHKKLVRQNWSRFDSHVIFIIYDQDEKLQKWFLPPKVVLVWKTLMECLLIKLI